MSILKPESLLSSGREHHIGRLQDGRVVKWPRSDREKGSKSFDTIGRELELLENLGVKMPRTELAGPSVIEMDGLTEFVPYALISDWVEGHTLRSSDFESTEVQRDFAHALEISKILEERFGKSIDFFTYPDLLARLGGGPVSNNFLVNAGGAYLVDTSLRDLNDVHSISKILKTKLWTHVQHALGKRLLHSR